TRKSRPSKCKIRVKLHRPLIKTDSFCLSIWVADTCFNSQAAEIRVISLRTVCRLNRQGSLLAASKLGLQHLSDCFSDFALDAEDVDELAIVRLRPQMRFACRSDELDVNANQITGFLDAALQNVCHPKLLRDLSQIVRCALVILCRRAGDHF